LPICKLKIDRHLHFVLGNTNFLGTKPDDTISEKKKILVLRNDLAINAGVQNLLSRQDTLDVIGQDIQDQAELFESITRIKPEVIVVDDDFLAVNLAALLVFLQRFPKIRTVVMSLTENHVQVYDTKKIPIQHIGDFLAVIYFPGTE